MGAVLRAAGPTDAQALAEVHQEVWRQTYRGVLSEEFLSGLELLPRLRFWREVLGRAEISTWLAEAPGPDAAGAEAGHPVVCGFASSRPADPEEPRDLELWGIYLLAGQQGRGLGQRLWDLAVGDRPCFLWVAEQNEAAQAFYRRNGMAPDGARRTTGWMEGLPVIRMVR